MSAPAAVADVASPRLLLAFAMAFVSAVIWGATPAATAIAVAGMEPIVAGMLRTVFAVPLVLCIALAGRLPLPTGRAAWGLLTLSGLGGFAGFTLLFTFGVAQTSTAHAGLILAGIPLLTGLGGAIVARQMPSRMWFLGAAIAISGEALLITGRGGAAGTASPSGDLMCIAATFCAAVGYVSGSRLSAQIGTWATTAWGITLAGVLQAPLLWWFTGATDWAAIPAPAWGGMAYLVVMAAVVGYAAWYWALSEGGVVRVSPVQYLQPLVSLVLAVVIFSEALSVPLISAAVMILTGVALARKG